MARTGNRTRQFGLKTEAMGPVQREAKGRVRVGQADFCWSLRKHKNIVKYIDSIRTDTHLNIVLEFIEGGSIAAILKKFGAFPETLCAIYTLQ